MVSLRSARGELAFSPTQFAAQYFVISQTRRVDELYFAGRLSDHDAIFGLELKSDLAVEGQKALLADFDEIKLDARGIGHDQRAIGQHVRADRSDDEGVERRMNDRPTGGERIGGGTCGGSDDQAVGAIATDVAAVNRNIEIQHAG